MKDVLMTLTNDQSQGEWESQYLLALSYLNFDYSLRLLLLPEALSSCSWTQKQWQALSLYGLKACYHFTDSPPIDSTLTNAENARKLFSNESESILHLCHWVSLKHFSQWLPFCLEQDSLLIFGSIKEKELNTVLNRWPNSLVYNIYSDKVSTLKTPGTSIDYNQSVNLIKKFTRTLTWN